jgi:hypothetical protein
MCDTCFEIVTYATDLQIYLCTKNCKKLVLLALLANDTVLQNSMQKEWFRNNLD